MRHCFWWDIRHCQWYDIYPLKARQWAVSPWRFVEFKCWVLSHLSAASSSHMSGICRKKEEKSERKTSTIRCGILNFKWRCRQNTSEKTDGWLRCLASDMVKHVTRHQRRFGFSSHWKTYDNSFHTQSHPLTYHPIFISRHIWLDLVPHRVGRSN